MDKSLIKPSLSGLSEYQLIKLVSDLSWPSFKGKVLHSWIYKKWANSFHEMSDLSKTERDYLEENYRLSSLDIKDKQVSKDKTIKYLWKTDKGELIESVRMYFEEHESFSACISSQVGCAVGCPFCATGAIGFKKNLTASQIIEQILNIQRDTKERLNNIVFMGQGEPLLNYDEVIKSLHLIKDSVSIGARRITISTSGIVPQIKKLADEKLQVTLAVSLHAPDQETREFLVPVSKKHKMDELMKSLHDYYKKTKRRITIEYVMLDGINDQIEKAKALSDLLKGLHCHINLIPYNPTDVDKRLKRTPMPKIFKFRDVLEKTSHKKVTIRHERGIDINAACGQLANMVK